jgi:hypothetical protein
MRHANTKFAQRVFFFAGIYGLLVLGPMYFQESYVGREYPPEITHPEFFYGFVGVAVAWQVLFLFMSRNPARYRPLIIPAILEKATFGIATLILLAQGRVSPIFAAGGSIDLVLGALFAYCYMLLGSDDHIA